MLCETGNGINLQYMCNFRAENYYCLIFKPKTLELTRYGPLDTLKCMLYVLKADISYIFILFLNSRNLYMLILNFMKEKQERNI